MPPWTVYPGIVWQNELTVTPGDIRAQAHLGVYCAHKIRGAVELARYRKSKDSQHKVAAIKHLGNALVEWRKYANDLDAQYNEDSLSWMVRLVGP